MLNQVSKLKGDEIFSLVTPEGEDKYIITKDLIGNVLNVVEDIFNRKKEQEPPPVPPIINECKDATIAARDAKVKACMALMNSEEALKNTSLAVGGINEAYRTSKEALTMALRASTIANKVNNIKEILDRVLAQTTLNVNSIQTLSESKVDKEYVDEEISNIREVIQLSVTRLSDIILQQVDSLDNIGIEVAELSTSVDSLQNTVLQLVETCVSLLDLLDLNLTLTRTINELSTRESNDIRNLLLSVNDLNTLFSENLQNAVNGLNATINSTYNGLEVTVTKSGNKYRIKLGGTTKGTIDITGVTVDNELSEESENPILNKAITEALFEVERVIAEALIDLNDRVTELEETANLLSTTVNSNTIPYYTVSYLDSEDNTFEKVELIRANDPLVLEYNGSSVDGYTLKYLEMESNGRMHNVASNYVSDIEGGFAVNIPHVTGNVKLDYHYYFYGHSPNPDIIFDDEDLGDPWGENNP